MPSPRTAPHILFFLAGETGDLPVQQVDPELSVFAQACRQFSGFAFGQQVQVQPHVVVIFKVGGAAVELRTHALEWLVAGVGIEPTNPLRETGF